MRAINQTSNVYSFDELSKEAKEYAIEKVRISDWYLSYEWWDFIYDDAKTIANLMGWSIDKIYFSGFWNQGDGACFEGILEYKSGAYKAVTEYAPNDEALAFIAREWQALQHRHFCALHATIKHTGHYYHERSMVCDAEDTRKGYWHVVPYETEKEILELCVEFAQWIYKNLEKEYNHLISDEAIAEFMIANEYEFTSDGEIYN